MRLGFKYKYIICYFLLFSYLFTLLKSNINTIDHLEIETNLNQIQTFHNQDDIYTTDININYSNIIKRTLLKSLIATFWLGLKESFPIKLLAKNIVSEEESSDTPVNLEDIENKETNFKDLVMQIDFYEFGKIYSDCLVDELFPNLNTTTKQKLIEMFIPIITSFIIVEFCIKPLNNSLIKEEYSYKRNYSKLATKLTEKIITKLLTANLLQKKSDPFFIYAKALAISASFYKYDKNKTNYSKYLNFYAGAEKIILVLIKNFMQSNVIKFKGSLNKKHYKKAFANTVKTILKPFIHHSLNLLEKKLENSSPENSGN